MSALPEKWTRPIVEGIILPAHAQTSAPVESALTFCGGRHELTLVKGHSGTNEMTIEANGCISPAQANVELELTLEGYETAPITRIENNAKQDAGSLLAAVTDVLVPSAHAAPAPKCSVTIKVRTNADGSYKAKFVLTCGAGIVQVLMHGAINGTQTMNLGWLDIAGCNPCGETSSTHPPSTEPCDTTSVTLELDALIGINLAVVFNNVKYLSNGDALTADYVGKTLYLENENYETMTVTATATLCGGGTKTLEELSIPARSLSKFNYVLTASDITDFEKITIMAVI